MTELAAARSSEAAGRVLKEKWQGLRGSFNLKLPLRPSQFKALVTVAKALHGQRFPMPSY